MRIRCCASTSRKSYARPGPTRGKLRHLRLYEHLTRRRRDKPAPTLDDLQPLYQAVAHGCLAGMQQEACDKVYRDRILRGTGSNGFYST